MQNTERNVSTHGMYGLTSIKDTLGETVLVACFSMIVKSEMQPL